MTSRSPRPNLRADASIKPSDPERVMLLQILSQLETAERLPALVRNLSAMKGRDQSVEERALERRLRFQHLPVLVSAGLVEYHEEDETVELTEAGEEMGSRLPDPL